jgi:hypothetical protein
MSGTRHWRQFSRLAAYRSPLTLSLAVADTVAVDLFLHVSVDRSELDHRAARHRDVAGDSCGPPLAKWNVAYCS